MLKPKPVMDSSNIIMAIVGLFFFLLIFLVLREVMLWYWKVNITIEKLESISISVSSLNEANRKQSRINFYKAKALGDNQSAYESLLEIVFDELLTNGLRNEERQQRYDEIKAKHTPTFEKLGYQFPEYALLFS
jgi:hypothetical protein